MEIYALRDLCTRRRFSAEVPVASEVIYLFQHATCMLSFETVVTMKSPTFFLQSPQAKDPKEPFHQKMNLLIFPLLQLLS